jgi:small-conductance mechanosensitive channel
MPRTILTDVVSPAQGAIALGVVVGAVLAGIVFERIILTRLRRFVERTRWRWDEVVTHSLAHVPVLWFFIAGVNTAAVSLPLHEDVSRLLNKALLVLFILSMTIVGARLVGGLLRVSLTHVEGVLPATSIFLNVAKATVFVVGGLIVLQALDISITPILTALGVGGLAVALALQDTLANLFAGLQIIAARQLKVGDFVQAEGSESGYVEDITWRTTTIRTLANNMVIIPNSKLAQTSITNYHQPEPAIAVQVGVGVSYDSDLEHVERVTLEVAREALHEVEGAEPDFEPAVRYKEFGESSINFTVVLRATEPQHQFALAHEFIKRLHARYNADGIEIPFPIRTVYMRNGEGHA